MDLYKFVHVHEDKSWDKGGNRYFLVQNAQPK